MRSVSTTPSLLSTSRLAPTADGASGVIRRNAGTGPQPVKVAANRCGSRANANTACAGAAIGISVRDVRAVLEALDGAVAGSVHKNGAGIFMLPGLLKVTAIKVPAKPKRKGINPFTKQEQWFAAKPATVKVKIRPLKRLKDAAM